MPRREPTQALFATTTFALALSWGCASGLAGEANAGGAGPIGLAGASNAAAGATSTPLPSPYDQEQRDKNADLYAVATSYFPSANERDAKKRVFRLTRAQLDSTTRALLPGHVVDSALASLPADPLQTNYEYADNLSFNAANFTPYANWIASIASSVQRQPESVIACAAQGNSASCLKEQAALFVRKAFRGIVTDTQLARFSDFYAASVAQRGFPDATADLVDLTLGSPNYVFRDEVLSDGAGTLLPAQLLQSISYTLADASPEALGLSSLDAKAAVQTPEALQATLDSALSNPAARAKLLRFFVSWLEVKEPADFTISSEVFPEFTPQVAAGVVKETKDFLERQLAGSTPRLRDLTESTQSIVSDPIAFIYGSNSGSGAAPKALDPSQRLGLFTLPAVLASHSGPTTTRLVKRGVFFTRKVMCLALGNPPAGVDTSLPVAQTGSERQRVESGTSRVPCSGCHRYINPFGFMLESYDAIGRFRTMDQGSPVDPSVSVDFVDGQPFQANTTVDALRGFTRSKQFQQCFARQLFRFYLGRDETPGDDPILRRMFFDFANQDQQSILGMLRTLAGSAALARRAEVQ